MIGASAGGIEALQQLARALPAGLPASLFVTVHFPEQASKCAPANPRPCGSIDGHACRRRCTDRACADLRRASGLPLGARARRDSSWREPKEHGNRPAIDPMFRSAALAFGRRVIGVVLTGTLDDGTLGLAAIKRCGGLAVVQDPADAAFSSMPRSAIDHVDVDRIVPIELARTDARRTGRRATARSAGASHSRSRGFALPGSRRASSAVTVPT